MKKTVFNAALLILVLFAAGANASILGYYESNGMTLALHSQGGPGTTLPGTAPDYDWYHGCSPTSAGMLAGYYDRYGYGGLSYGNLLPGAVAESNTFGPGPYAVNDIIASPGHIADFYNGPFGASGDDVSPPFHSFNSLADFMGTSQDAHGNSNGMTTFWFNPSGARLYASNLTPAEQDRSGMYGVWEYFNYSGYNTAGPGQNFYNQYIAGYNDNTLGFDFSDYMTEIDAGRGVIVHIEGHSMYGYGYDDLTNEILFHDTWSPGEHRMLWGGFYSGDPLLGVTVVIPEGGSEVVPLPGAIWLLGSGLMGIVAWRRRQ